MFQANQQIGGYTLIKQIGRGGFGEVWLAEKRSQFVTKKVAIKLPLDAQVDFNTIRNEASLWEQASGHPNVLPIIDADVYDGQVIIVSEYAEGGSLSEKLQSEGKFSPEKAVELTIGILNGLDYLHSQKIIHRDIKPQNILLQRDTPRLADFGISRAMEGTTSSVTISGTDAYMAPESFEGKRNVQTDIWSVGVVLYQLLSGRLPFSQPNPHERMFAIVTKDFEPLSADVHQKLREIVHKALAKLAENRYQSAKEMREDLEKELVQIKHPSFAPTAVLEKKQIDNLTIDDNSVVTEIPAFPDPNKTQPSPIDDLTKFEPPSKPLPTEAQKFVEAKENAKKKSRNWSRDIGLIVFIIIGIFALNRLYYWSQSSKTVTSSNISSNSNSNRNSNPNISSNNSNPNISNTNKNTSSGNLSNNSNTLPEKPSDEILAKLKAKYEKVDGFYDGIAVVKLKGKYGYVDSLGNEIVPPKYDEAGIIYHSFARVKLGNKWTYVDKSGKEITPFKYDDLSGFENGLSEVRVDKKWGYIDSIGNEIIPPKYDSAASFYGKIASVKLNNKYGCIDKSGNEIIPIKYDETDCIGDILLVKLNNKYGFVDDKGNEVIPLKYDKAFYFRDDLTSVKLNGKWGFIDKTGNEAIPIKYDDTNGFQDNVAPVKLNGKWGVIDNKGNTIVPFEFDDISNFSNGKATAKLKGRWTEIDKNGNEVKKSKTP